MNPHQKHMLITRHDLSEMILLVKKETGWYYSEMAEWTGISRASLQRYATKTKFPKDPEKVYQKVKQALIKYRKERSKWYGYDDRKANRR